MRLNVFITLLEPEIIMLRLSLRQTYSTYEQTLAAFSAAHNKKILALIFPKAWSKYKSISPAS
jgi:hypothetical protein